VPRSGGGQVRRSGKLARRRIVELGAGERLKAVGSPCDQDPSVLEHSSGMGEPGRSHVANCGERAGSLPNHDLDLARKHEKRE
jgi:hypothetical protein